MARMTQTMDDMFAVNPLEDPIVRSTLEKIKMSGRDLINITVKDLNKRLVGCSHATISRLKKCRRTLKNRGYAKSCRIKRLCLRNELERNNAKLRAELTDLKLRNKLLQNQLIEMQRSRSIQSDIVVNQSRHLSQQATSKAGQNYYHHHSHHQQNPLVYEQQQASIQCDNYGSQSNFMPGDDQVQRIHQHRYIDNSSNASQVSSSSSSLCMNYDYGPFDGDLDSNCRFYRSCEFNDIPNREVQAYSMYQPGQPMNNQIEFY